jgi:hypothetical protein
MGAVFTFASNAFVVPLAGNAVEGRQQRIVGPLAGTNSMQSR